MHFCIHESVHWLVRKGGREEAAQILNEMNARVDIPREQPYTPEEIEIPEKKSSENGKKQLRALLSKGYLRKTIGIRLVAFSTCALSYGLTNWMPTVLTRSGYSLSSSYALTTLMNSIGCLGAAFAGYMADKVGRIHSTYIWMASLNTWWTESG